MLVAHRPERIEVGHGDVGVRDRLDVEQLRAGQRSSDRVEIVRRCERDIDPVSGQDRMEERVCAAVELRARHDAFAGANECGDDRVDGRHPAREPVCGLGALEVRHGVLESLHGRIAVPTPVHESRASERDDVRVILGSVEAPGGRLIDGNGRGLLPDLGCLRRVHRSCGEPSLVLFHRAQPIASADPDESPPTGHSETKAVTSISTRIAGSTNPVTPTIVFAGRISANTSPCARPASSHLEGSLR